MKGSIFVSKSTARCPSFAAFKFMMNRKTSKSLPSTFVPLETPNHEFTKGRPWR